MFTACSDVRVAKDIGDDIATIVEAIKAEEPSYDAIYLVGSFGRSEGAAYFDGDRWRALNDYDLLIVSSSTVSDADVLKKLGHKLAQTLRVDFVDIGWLSRSALRKLSPSIANYDLKNASLCLAGHDVLEDIPKFDVREIPAFEFVQLICNRIAGILSTKLPLSTRSPQYRTNQYVKACAAVGDVAIYLGKQYHPSYSERQKMFVSLAKTRQIPFFLSDDAIALVISAYTNKLSNGAKEGFDIDDALMRDMIKSAFLAIAVRCVGEKVDSVKAAGEALLKHYCNRRSFIERVDDLICVWIHRDKRRAGELTYRILFSLPAVYIECPPTAFGRWISYVSRYWPIPGALSTGRADLTSVVWLWEEYCH
jgi:predicted nucleotidyltransferase